MKAGDDRLSTAEIISFVDPSFFDQWQGQPWRRRAPEYYALKERIADALLALVERHIPGFTELVTYKELATPLTIQHFTGRQCGRMYGLADTPEKFNCSAIHVRTPIRGLYMTGSGACSLGIVGALLGGVGTASRLNGPLGFLRIMKQAAAASKQQPAARDLNKQRPRDRRGGRVCQPLSGQKLPAVLVEKVRVTQTVYELVFELPVKTAFEPGQYARVSVGEYHWRDYSIVDLCDNKVCFLIDTRFQGIGSQFVSCLSPGTSTFMRLPVGDFKITDKRCPHCFIATGTGISPFIPMIESLLGEETPPPIALFFGCRFQQDAVLTDKIMNHPAAHKICMTVCISREVPSDDKKHGRVTDILPEGDFDLDHTHFYICGNPSMIADTVALLLKRGAKNIFREDY